MYANSINIKDVIHIAFVLFIYLSFLLSNNAVSPQPSPASNWFLAKSVKKVRIFYMQLYKVQNIFLP